MATLRMAQTVRQVQSKIGYKFKDTRHLWEALQAPGSVVRSGEVEGRVNNRHSVGFQRCPDGNRRLACFGDAVLKLALIEIWYKGDEVRERLSRIESDVSSNSNLDMVGRTNGLDALINKNPAELNKSVGATTMAATVEAIIGAVYLDSDMKSVVHVMQNLGLIPRLIRRTGQKVPVSKSSKSPSATTSNSHEESEIMSEDVEAGLLTTTESSQELEKKLRDLC